MYMYVNIYVCIYIYIYISVCIGLTRAVPTLMCYYMYIMSVESRSHARVAYTWCGDVMCDRDYCVKCHIQDQERS